MFRALRGLDLKGGNQKHEAETRIDREFLMPIVARDDKAAKLGRRGVIGMAFELGAKSEDLGALERAIERARSTRAARRAAP